MKFNENVNQLLIKYPLNEDLGSIFGTLGRMVKNAVKDDIKYILEPTGLVNSYNQAKPDKSKGDDIITDMADLLIRDQTISRKQIKFLINGKQVPPNKLLSYNDLESGEIKSSNPNYNPSARYDPNNPDDDSYIKTINYKNKIDKIIKQIDLNKYNLINKDKQVVLQKIKEVLQNRKQRKKEYGDEETKPEMSPENLYKRYEYLIQKVYFVPFSKNIEEKTKWLFILAQPNSVFEFKGELEGEQKEEETPSTTPPTPRTPTPRTPTPRTPTPRTP